MKSQLTIAVLHRSALFREVVSLALGRDPRFRCLDANHLGPRWLESLDCERPDVIFLDLELPEGTAVELIRHVHLHEWHAKVIIFVSSLNNPWVVDCNAAGVHGWIHRSSSLEDLLTAIGEVIENRTFCSPQLIQSMFTHFAHVARGARAPHTTAAKGLTQRETEVLALLSAELSNREIAKRLNVSLFTVKNHVHNILEKLAVDSRQRAVSQAFHFSR